MAVTLMVCEVVDMLIANVYVFAFIEVDQYRKVKCQN